MAKKKSLKKMFKDYLGDDDGFFSAEVDGRRRLPRIGERCLFRLRTNAPVNGGHACFEGFCAFGYMCDKDVVYLPLYLEKLDAGYVDAWKRVAGEHFWNGSGRSKHEAFQ